MEAIQEQYIATSYFHHRVFSILNLPSWFSSMRPPDYEMQEHLHHISLDGTKHRDELENKTTKTVLPQKSKSKTDIQYHRDLQLTNNSKETH
jgi:hypothetical protein